MMKQHKDGYFNWIEYEDHAEFVVYKNEVKYFIIVDLEDVPKIINNINSWYLCKQIGEVPRVAVRYGEHGKVKRDYLHRFLIKAPKELIVDHKDNNPLNNRKLNLRLADMSNNMLNRRGAARQSKTQVRGVYYDKCRDKYVAALQVNGEVVFRKRFDTISEAIEAVKQARAKYAPFSKEASED